MTNSPNNASPAADHDRLARQRMFSLLEQELDHALATLDGNAPLMLRMARYHLGMTDPAGESTEESVRVSVQGKRIRPLIAMHTAEAVGGSAEHAAPVAAAVELLHNFTLIHDDIQDRSPNRRHRPTVWRIWGNAQAINAGDALFAAAQLALTRTMESQADPAIVLQLLEAFNHTTIDIVRGQVLDLENEGRADVTPDDYLTMINGKTAAIVRFSAWAGAIVGGADEDVVGKLAEAGEALGLGFQLRDDMLGIWSPAEETGKDAADDIRRRKQSLPIVILRNRASDEELERLNALYRAEEIDPDGVQEILSLLGRHDVAKEMQQHVDDAHNRARAALDAALPGESNPSLDALNDLITQLSTRLS